jgi:ADP-ribosyl-[dinitrogen reductase] hydrolase
MMGAIAGDVIGSPFEFKPYKSTEFHLFGWGNRFTDDTVLTIATADSLLHGEDYTSAYKRYGRNYPNAGFGGAFMQWMMSSITEPYGSWGNGSAMRVAPVGWAFDSWEHVLEEAKRSAEATHNHPEGIKGAVATAGAIYLARTTKDKGEILNFLAGEIGYDMDRTIDAIRPNYRFDVSCQGSVPEALIAFLEAENFEQAIRLAISLGGDADTQACIAGAVSEAFWGIPDDIYAATWNRLPDAFHDIIREFADRFGLPYKTDEVILPL